MARNQGFFKVVLLYLVHHGMLVATTPEGVSIQKRHLREILSQRRPPLEHVWKPPLEPEC